MIIGFEVDAEDSVLLIGKRNRLAFKKDQPKESSNQDHGWEKGKAHPFRGNFIISYLLA